MLVLSRRVRLISGMLFALLLVSTGCSDKVAQQVGEMNKSNIQRVGNMYAAFQNTVGGGRGPKDEAEFTKFIREYDPNKLQMMGIDANNVSGLLTSERDGKPFKIRYNVSGGRGAVAPVAFEQDGKDGKKQVGFTGGKVEEVDDTTYKEYWSGKSGTTAPAAGPTGRPTGSGPPPGAPTGPPKQ